ncbi:MAG: hypothetical protein CMF96_01025 [Candidatus Marinimicrobia bacterium]|nr:hypothetical protein [Candidatus Neomarinimicrobiota bacterium]
MNRKLIFILLLSFGCSIGIDGLKIPLNIISLKNGRTSQIGLSSLNQLFNENSFIEFNYINWIPGIDGKSINWKNSNNFIKYFSISSIVDNEVYYYGEVPSDKSDFKLPASLYTASIVIAKNIVGLNSIIEIKPFLSRLYYYKNYGLILNTYIEKHINTSNYFTISFKNFGILPGLKSELSLFNEISMQYNKKINNNFNLIGLGFHIEDNHHNTYLTLSYNKSILTTNFSLDYSSFRGFGYSGGILIDYNNFTVGYISSSSVIESLSNSQIISVKFHF